MNALPAALVLAASLEAAPAPKPVDPLIEGLVMEHLHGDHTRFKELYAKRDKTLPVILAKLESKDPALITNSLDLLLRVDVEGDGAVDRPDVIDAAARALDGRLACKDNRGDISCADITDSALRILERLDPRRATGQVRAALLIHVRKREGRAVKALGRLGDSSQLADLEVFSHDADQSLAKASRLAMARLGHAGYLRETMDALKGAASRSWPRMNEPFEDAAYIRDRRLVRLVAGWLYDCVPAPPEPAPKGKKLRDRVGYFPRCHLAAKALAQMVDKPPVRSESPSPADIEAWRAWWAKSQKEYP